MKKMLKLGLGAAIAGAAFAGMVAVPASAAETDAPQVIGKFTFADRTYQGDPIDYWPVVEPSGAGPVMSGDRIRGDAAAANAAAGDFLFPADGALGPIKPASNPDLCMTYSNAGSTRWATWAACDGSASQQFQIKPGDTTPSYDFSKNEYVNNSLDSYLISVTNSNSQVTAGSYTYASWISSTDTFVPYEEASDAAPVDITDATITENVATAINGKGEPGSTITVSDANGEIGTAVVDDNGDWTVPSNITESTTVTATDGITDDTYEIHIADVPLIAAPVALGALALGGVGFGGVMLRRRQKAGADA